MGSGRGVCAGGEARKLGYKIGGESMGFGVEGVEGGGLGTWMRLGWDVWLGGMLGVSCLLVFDGDWAV